MMRLQALHVFVNHVEVAIDHLYICPYRKHTINRMRSIHNDTHVPHMTSDAVIHTCSGYDIPHNDIARNVK